MATSKSDLRRSERLDAHAHGRHKHLPVVISAKTPRRSLHGLENALIDGVEARSVGAIRRPRLGGCGAAGSLAYITEGLKEIGREMEHSMHP